MLHLVLIVMLGLMMIVSADSSRAEDARGPSLFVVPWNGHAGAVSLTFDDGEPTHLDHAVTALDRRGMKGTFFIVQNKLPRREEWPAVFANGHELGNHSLDHLHASELDAEGERKQTVDAQKALSASFNQPVRVYAYPYVEMTPGMQQWLAKTHLAARAGDAPRYVLKPTDDPDWTKLPSRVTLSTDTRERYSAWMQEAEDERGWLIVMLHSIAGDWYQPIPVEVFEAMLDEIEKRDLWCATMGEVTSYWQAQKVLERTTPKTLSNGGASWTWQAPALFPEDLTLKVRLTSPTGANGAWRVTQAGEAIQPDESGVYTIRVKTGDLTVQPS